MRSIEVNSRGPARAILSLLGIGSSLARRKDLGIDDVAGRART
jgi:hypothetical protein